MTFQQYMLQPCDQIAKPLLSLHSKFELIAC